MVFIYCIEIMKLKGLQFYRLKILKIFFEVCLANEREQSINL